MTERENGYNIPTGSESKPKDIPTKHVKTITIQNELQDILKNIWY